MTTLLVAGQLPAQGQLCDALIAELRGRDGRRPRVLAPAKMAALQVYASELRPSPHSRSPESVDELAASRGATVGVARAEDFVLGRTLW